MEKSWKPPFRLATALPETAAGMGGNLGSSAPESITAHRISRKKAESFFIAEILPHLAETGCRNQVATLRTAVRTRSCGGIHGRHRRTPLRGRAPRDGREGSA